MPTIKNLVVSDLSSSRPNSMNEKGSMILFTSDKPIPYPRSHKDLPETPAAKRDHHIGRSPAPPCVPLYDKNTVTTSQNFSFSSGGPATPLYCPSTMKLLKNNFDNSKVPPGTLLIPAKGNPNDISSFTKISGFPPPSPNIPTVTKIAHQEAVNKPREVRKPNPDMFLNSFSGGTFIPPTVPGGHPTFIPAATGFIHESKDHAAVDGLLRAPPPKKGRGRKPKHSKKTSVSSSVGIPDPGSHIDFSKSPPNASNIPMFNNPPTNLINAGFRPPVIRNTIPPVPSSRSISMDVRGIRPRIANIGNQPHSTTANKFLIPRSSVVKGSPHSTPSFPIRSSHPVNVVNNQQTPSPGSPTYNHPRFVLLNMPTVMMVTTPGNDTSQVLQRQHSMTSPTFPPPNS